MRRLIQNIWADYQSPRRTQTQPRTMSIIPNPYNHTFDLTDRSHLKLYTDGCQGLAKEVKFDGKRKNYSNFVKVIGNSIDTRRIKDVLKIGTTWETTGTRPDLLDFDGLQDLFESIIATETQIENTID